jgi:hypothetical protein
VLLHGGLVSTSEIWAPTPVIMVLAARIHLGLGEPATAVGNLVLLAICLFVAWGPVAGMSVPDTTGWWPGSCCATVEPCFATGATIWPGIPGPGTWSLVQVGVEDTSSYGLLGVIPGRVGMGVDTTEDQLLDGGDRCEGFPWSGCDERGNEDHATHGR